MLILTRHEEESIMIGDEIEIKVLGIGSEEGKEHQVRIGILAPRKFGIYRKELRQPHEEKVNE